jgi:hypothetical protein
MHAMTDLLPQLLMPGTVVTTVCNRDVVTLRSELK